MKSLTFLYLAHQHVGQAVNMREINTDFLEIYQVKRQHMLPKPNDWIKPKFSIVELTQSTPRHIILSSG